MKLVWDEFYNNFINSINKMKVVTEQQEVTVYEAVDGIRFELQESCKEYEKTLRCALNAQYRDMIIAKTTEHDLLGFGNDDIRIEFVQLRDNDDITLILQLVALNPGIHKIEDKILDAALTVLKEALDADGVVLIYRCDDNYYHIINSRKGIIDRLNQYEAVLKR